MWFEATRRGLAVHPWGSQFLFQHLLEAPEGLSDWERGALSDAARGFDLDAERPILLILRISRWEDPPLVRSLRRPREAVLNAAPLMERVVANSV